MCVPGAKQVHGVPAREDNKTEQTDTCTGQEKVEGWRGGACRHVYGAGEGGGEGGAGEKVNTTQHEFGLFATLMQVSQRHPH